MKQLKALIIISIATAWSTSKINTSYADWDINKNQALDRYEFINGYEHSDYFGTWGNGKNPITYEELYEKIFGFRIKAQPSSQRSPNL